MIVTHSVNVLSHKLVAYLLRRVVHSVRRYRRKAFDQFPVDSITHTSETSYEAGERRELKGRSGICEELFVCHNYKAHFSEFPCGSYSSIQLGEHSECDSMCKGSYSNDCFRDCVTLQSLDAMRNHHTRRHASSSHLCSWLKKFYFCLGFQIAFHKPWLTLAMAARQS